MRQGYLLSIWQHWKALGNEFHYDHYKWMPRVTEDLAR